MSELEEKLGNILNDPNMMQQIMGMAKMLSASSPQEPKEVTGPPESAPHPPQDAAQPPVMDPKMLQIISGIASKGSTDKNQEFLLKALQPYLSRDRIRKLERAMGAAKMASAASAFLNAGGIRQLSQR